MDAKLRCTREGSSLFYPEGKDEALYVASIIQEHFPKDPKAWIGISDILTEGEFETITGNAITHFF